MDWANETYVRLYVRRTVTWEMWPWEAQALFPQILQVLDRAGVLDTGKFAPADCVARKLPLWPREVIDVGLSAIIASGSLVHEGDRLLMPNYLDAQETKSRSNAAERKRKSRAKQRAEAKSASRKQPDEIGKEANPGVTMSHPVTTGVTESQPVTDASPYATLRDTTPPDEEGRDKPQPLPSSAPNTQSDAERWSWRPLLADLNMVRPSGARAFLVGNFAPPGLLDLLDSWEASYVLQTLTVYAQICNDDPDQLVWWQRDKLFGRGCFNEIARQVALRSKTKRDPYYVSPTAPLPPPPEPPPPEETPEERAANLAVVEDAERKFKAMMERMERDSRAKTEVYAVDDPP